MKLRKMSKSALRGLVKHLEACLADYDFDPDVQEVIRRRSQMWCGRCHPEPCRCQRYHCMECHSRPLETDRKPHTEYHHGKGQHLMCDHHCCYCQGVTL